MRSISNARAVA